MALFNEKSRNVPPAHTLNNSHASCVREFKDCQCPRRQSQPSSGVHGKNPASSTGTKNQNGCARFFAAAAPSGVEPTPDGAETERAWWARPADLLAPGVHDLFPPTRAVLGALAGCADVASALAVWVDTDEEAIAP